MLACTSRCGAVICISTVQSLTAKVTRFRYTKLYITSLPVLGKFKYSNCRKTVVNYFILIYGAIGAHSPVALSD